MPQFNVEYMEGDINGVDGVSPLFFEKSFCLRRPGAATDPPARAPLCRRVSFTICRPDVGAVQCARAFCTHGVRGVWPASHQTPSRPQSLHSPFSACDEDEDEVCWHASPLSPPWSGPLAWLHGAAQGRHGGSRGHCPGPPRSGRQQGHPEHCKPRALAPLNPLAMMHGRALRWSREGA